MQAALEGLLFLAGDDGISFEKLKEILEIDEKTLNKILCDLEKNYESKERGLSLEMLGNKIKITTKREHSKYYEKYFSFDKENVLTPSALEVLAIIAYNDPSTRGAIDEIRGISSSHIIRKLISKNLIEVKGKSDLPGRPNLYGVTERFFDYFGLRNNEDLPSIEVEEIEAEEKELYNSKYNEQDIEKL